MASGRNRKGTEAICPACGSALFFRKRPGRGKQVNCPHCDSLLVVLHQSPLELEWAFEDPVDFPHEKYQMDEYVPDGWEIDEYVDDDDFETDPWNGRHD
jgi:DNA-directed RNA polymerase subunit RPC12/RpoP